MNMGNGPARLSAVLGYNNAQLWTRRDTVMYNFVSYDTAGFVLAVGMRHTGARFVPMWGIAMLGSVPLCVIMRHSVGLEGPSTCRARPWPK